MTFEAKPLVGEGIKGVRLVNDHLKPQLYQPVGYYTISI